MHRITGHLTFVFSAINAVYNMNNIPLVWISVDIHSIHVYPKLEVTNGWIESP